jgi:hypothetical protein
MQRLAPSRSRRTLVEGSLAASVLAALGLNQDVFATKHGVATDACIPTGRKCPARRPRGKKGRKLRCRQCCQGYSIRGRRGSASAPASREGSPAPRSVHRTAAPGRARGDCALVSAWGLNARPTALTARATRNAVAASATSAGPTSLVRPTSVLSAEPAVRGARATRARAAVRGHARPPTAAAPTPTRDAARS